MQVVQGQQLDGDSDCDINNSEPKPETASKSTFPKQDSRHRAELPFSQSKQLWNDKLAVVKLFDKLLHEKMNITYINSFVIFELYTVLDAYYEKYKQNQLIYTTFPFSWHENIRNG